MLVFFCFFFLTATAVITLPAVTSSDEEGPSWLPQSSTGMDPFRMAVAAVEQLFTCEHWVCTVWLTVWAFLFGSALTTGGGRPIKKNWSLKVAPGGQPFSAALHFVACFTEPLLLAAVGSSLLVLLLTGFAPSSVRSSFRTVTPWCSETVRHTGGSDGKQEEFPALNCGKGRILANSEYHEDSTVDTLYNFFGWKAY